MHIMVVDNNLSTCDELVQQVKEAWPQETVDAFTDPLLGLKHGINHPVELLIAAAEMRGAGGQDLARILRQHHPNLYAVYVTSSLKRRKTDFEIAPNATIQRPITAEKLQQLLSKM